MSGGAFDYQQFRLEDIAAEIEHLIKINDSDEKTEWGDDVSCHYSPEIIEKFQETVKVLRTAGKMVHHIDYLVSGDYGEKSFLKRWKEDTL